MRSIFHEHKSVVVPLPLFIAIYKSRMDAYNVGDLVWGKMRNFPPWPGRVLDPPKDKKVHVYFYGTKDHAFLEEKFVQPHSKSMLASCKAKKMSRSLQLAVLEIQQAAGDPKKETSFTEQGGHAMLRRPATVCSSIKLQLKQKYAKLQKRKSTLKSKVIRKRVSKPKESQNRPTRTDTPYNLRPIVVPEPTPEPIQEPTPISSPWASPEPTPISSPWNSPEPTPVSSPWTTPASSPESTPGHSREPSPERGPLLSSCVAMRCSNDSEPHPSCCQVCGRPGRSERRARTPCCLAVCHITCIMRKYKKEAHNLCPKCGQILHIGLNVNMTVKHEISFRYEFHRKNLQGLFVPNKGPFHL